jgi:F-type H+-transporting ATPase subunit b
MALTKNKKRFLLIFLGAYLVFSIVFAVFVGQGRKLYESPQMKQLAAARKADIQEKLKDAQGFVTYKAAKSIYDDLYGPTAEDPDKEKHIQEIRSWASSMAGKPTDEQVEKVYAAIYGPKLDPIAVNFTMIMQVVNFGALATILYILLWEPLIKFLDARKKKVQDEMDAAAAAKTEAGKLNQEYRRKLHDARDDAARLVEEGRRRAEEKEKEILEDARRAAERIKEHARAKLAAAEAAVRKMLRSEFAAVSVSIAEKILEREITDKDHAALVEDALAGLGKEGMKFD